MVEETEDKSGVGVGWGWGGEGVLRVTTYLCTVEDFLRVLQAAIHTQWCSETNQLVYS